MLALHRVLSPIYVLKLAPKDFLSRENIKNLLVFQYRNKPGVTDCNTYLDELLAAVDEPPKTTTRFIDSDKPTALWIRDALYFLSPLSKKFDYYQQQSVENNNSQQVFKRV